MFHLIGLSVHFPLSVNSFCCVRICLEKSKTPQAFAYFQKLFRSQEIWPFYVSSSERNFQPLMQLFFIHRRNQSTLCLCGILQPSFFRRFFSTNTEVVNNTNKIYLLYLLFWTINNCKNFWRFRKTETSKIGVPQLCESVFQICATRLSELRQSETSFWAGSLNHHI